MVDSKLLLLISLPVFVVAVPIAPELEPKCPGGHTHGQLVDRGRYWYSCEHGHLMPMGCFADDRTRLNIDGTFNTKGYVLQCVLDTSGDLTFKYKACLNEQQETFGPNETWQDERYWYICTVRGDYLQPNVGGCVHEGKRFGVGGVVEMKGFLYECKRSDKNTSALCPVACVHQGKRYDIEQTFEIGEYWYTCTMYQGRIARVCVGCLHQEKRLMDGERYFQRDSIFECEIRNNSQPEHRLVGCRDFEDDVEIERRLGCVWTVGKYPMEYRMQCMPQHGRSAVKTVINCYYKNFELAPGCFRMIDDETVACKEVDGVVSIERSDAQTGMLHMLNQGLTYCTSGR